MPFPRALPAALAIFVAGLVAAPSAAWAAATAWVGAPRAEARLITGVDGARPGEVIPAGLQFRLGEGWHAYWRTPGDAGIAPRIDWSASTNVEAVHIDWPAPQRLDIPGLQNAVYSGAFILPLSVMRRDPTAAAQLVLAVDYAICGKICVPAHADLSVAVPAGDGAPSAEAPALADARAMVPGGASQAGFVVDTTSTADAGQGRQLTLTIRSVNGPFLHPDLFVESASPGLPPAPAVLLGDEGRVATITAELPRDIGDHLTLTLVDGGRSAELPLDLSASDGSFGLRHLAAVMAVALLGGLILNVMPCVMPVLVIKLGSVLRHADRRRRDARLGFLATAAGIMASFLVLAAALIGLKSAGAEVGWGIQFQQPWFLAMLAVVTTLFAASLFDWLPIGLPRVLSRLPGPLGRGAHLDSFLAGIMSTLLATPCSAPFVGTAIGFALARGPLEILAVFVSLGLGMSLPLLLVAAVPGLVTRLPRPGAWMLYVRTVSGVLMLGTAGWLLFLLGAVTSPRAAVVAGVLLASLLTLRFAVVRRPDVGAYGAAATAVLAAGAVLVVVAAPAPRSEAHSADWVAFDPAAIDDAVAAGRTVLVDVTATWCLTCKLNELSTFDRKAVRDRLVDDRTLRMRADWSRPDARIATYLRSFGRFGIPFDVVYGPGQPQGLPLPELLTPGLLVSALDQSRVPSTKSAGMP